MGGGVNYGAQGKIPHEAPLTPIFPYISDLLPPHEFKYIIFVGLVGLVGFEVPRRSLKTSPYVSLEMSLS